MIDYKLKTKIMKREIKFRAWCSTRKKFVDPIYNNTILSDLFELPFYEMQQFTGLKDKNGVEIYEGDILGFEVIRKFKEEYVQKFVITWDYENAGWIQFSPKNKVVVLGNIHENPELLNQ